MLCNNINTLNIEKRLTLEQDELWGQWGLIIPYLRFREEYEIKIIPPTVGAMVRFIVKYKDNSVSVFLDCYDRLGSVGAPYWEVYPNLDNDISRFYMYETDELIKEIDAILLK